MYGLEPALDRTTSTAPRTLHPLIGAGCEHPLELPRLNIGITVLSS